MAESQKTATYKVVADAGGGRVFRFYCDISGELCCVTKPIRADTEEAALEIAWETEGRWEFNHCPKCGKYVSSAMFNVNAGLCLDCAPWEDEYPRSAITVASASRNRTPASAPSVEQDCRWAAQTERREPPNDKL